MKLPLLSLFIFIGLYLLRLDAIRPSFQEGQMVRVSGPLSEEPTLVDGRQKLVVGNIRVYLEQFPEYHYGDRIVVEGEVAKGKGGWYLKDPRVAPLDDARGKQVSLYGLRRRILELYGKFLPEPHSALLSGIVLGTKSSLAPTFFEGLKTTGTLHVVVASGMNISLFAGSILTILAVFMGRRRAILPSLFAIFLYVALVGFQPPIVRAAIMGSIAFTAQAYGREFDAWRALFLSAAVLLLINPLWLFDVGFQLSFAATAGMLAFGSRLNTFLGRVPQFVRGDLATTLSAQIAVFPILLFSFGQVSLISPLVNVLILWTVPFIMIGGMIIALLGLIFEPIGQIAAWFVWLLLEYFVRVVGLFS
ncbi:MAG: ComEC/Rec2 family competence protein [bacterium]|nr:ComEC/Rec2 family competence protein [bacterium]